MTNFFSYYRKILKIIITYFIGLTLFFACEKDDFCLENPVTPKLVIRFYDNLNRDITKRVDRLSIFVENTTDTIFRLQNTDSIAIPLNPSNFLSRNTTTTTYVFRTEDERILDTNKEAKLTISFNPQEDYVSRSCGFRIIFNNVTISTIENGWISEINTENLTTINSQNAAHIQIFH